jgi:hypothetical protein
MTIYRDAVRDADTRAEIRRIAAEPDPTDALVAFGELEAAVADALNPHADGLDPVCAAFRTAAERLCAGDPSAAAPLAELPLPRAVRPKRAEGFAYYGLYPQAYRAAAREAAAIVGDRPALCLGLRGIGAPLSAVVCATLRQLGVRARSWTVRPRGHPFGRRPVLSPDLAARIRDGDPVVLVVDEGPGLSGSSLCGTAAALEAIGVPAADVVLLPAHVPDGSGFVDPDARARWMRHRKVAVPFDRAWAGVPGDARDLSGGLWRAAARADPPAHPHHERLKFLRADGTLLRFVGLGPVGRAATARAATLAALGFGPETSGMADGMLRQRWLAGRRLGPGDGSHALHARAAAYIAARARAFATGRGTDAETLLALVDGEARAAGLAVPDLAPWRPLLADAPEAVPDGSMRPHDWVALPDGRLLKTAGADHGDGHFAPGPTDPAWDAAAHAEAFGLDEQATAAFADDLAARLGDPALPRRLPLLRAAVLAFGHGYARLAATGLGDAPDGRRFAEEAAALRTRLAAALSGLRLAAPGQRRHTPARAPERERAR